MTNSEYQPTSDIERQEAELVDRLTKFTFDFADAAIKGENKYNIPFKVLRGGGTEALGAVPGRPDDDTIQLDVDAWELFQEMATQHNLKIVAYSEDGKSLVGIDNEEEAEVEASVDPIDNSGKHEAGLDTAIYTPFSFFNKKHQPLVGAIIDYSKKRLLMYANGKNTLYEYDEIKDTEGKTIRWERNEREINDPPLRNIEDPKFVLITYIGSNLYSVPFIKRFMKTLERMHPKGRFHGEGGSHAPLNVILSGGAYVMVGDIRTENSQAYIIAKAQGYGVWEYTKDRIIRDYEFIPELENNEQSLYLLIMARTEEIRDGFIADFEASIVEEENQKRKDANLKASGEWIFGLPRIKQD